MYSPNPERERERERELHRDAPYASNSDRLSEELSRTQIKRTFYLQTYVGGCIRFRDTPSPSLSSKKKKMRPGNEFLEDPVDLSPMETDDRAYMRSLLYILGSRVMAREGLYESTPICRPRLILILILRIKALYQYLEEKKRLELSPGVY